MGGTGRKGAEQQKTARVAHIHLVSVGHARPLGRLDDVDRVAQTLGNLVEEAPGDCKKGRSYGKGAESGKGAVSLATGHCSQYQDRPQFAALTWGHGLTFARC